MKLTSRLTTCLLAGCIGFAVLPASHANNENRDYLTADDTLRMYEYEIESETIKRVNKSIDTAELAKEIGLRPPVMPPNLSQEQVRAQVEQEITDAVEQKYPSSYFNQIKLDAVAKHRLYSLDEEITITVRNRNGLWVPMTGALRKVDDGGIRLGDQWFNKEDIRSSDHVHFYREEHTLAREAYSRTQTGQYAAKREDYTTKMRRALEFKIWRRYGYVYLRARNQYYPESEYYLFRLEKARTDRYEEMRSAVEMSVMKREGWRWNVDTNTWMNTRIVNTPAATPAEERSALDDFKEFLSGGKPKDDKPVIPTLVGPEDDSFNFWGPNEGKGGDDLFGTGGGESTTGGGAAPEPAPAPAPAPNDQVESIFDED